MVIDVEARILLKRLQYQAESATISKDDKYLLCNMGQVRTQNIVNLFNIWWFAQGFCMEFPDVARVHH